MLLLSAMRFEAVKLLFLFENFPDSNFTIIKQQNAAK